MNFIMILNVVAVHGKTNAQATPNALKRSNVLIIMLKCVRTAPADGIVGHHPAWLTKPSVLIIVYVMA